MAKSKKETPRKRAKQNRISNSQGITGKEFKGTKSENSGHFQPGNKFWQIRSKHGREKLFASPELMWEAACEYFQWCDDNPLQEQRVSFGSYGQVTHATVNKVRAYTLHGLCRYLGCNTEYFRNFKNQKRVDQADFSSVIKAIEEAIYQQKFEHAAADQLNANIISRDLGLADTQKVDLLAERKSVADLFPTELDGD